MSPSNDLCRQRLWPTQRLKDEILETVIQKQLINILLSVAKQRVSRHWVTTLSLPTRLLEYVFEAELICRKSDDYTTKTAREKDQDEDLSLWAVKGQWREGKGWGKDFFKRERGKTGLRSPPVTTRLPTIRVPWRVNSIGWCKIVIHSCKYA